MKKSSILLIVSLLITLSVCCGSPVGSGLNIYDNSTNNDTLVSRRMIYPIYVYGSKVLREPAIEIANDYPNLDVLVENMFATMYESEGVGIAAPQIGKSIRLFVVDVPLVVAEGEEPQSFVEVFINPTIYNYSEGLETLTEGCLSLPGLSGEVIRPNSIRIRYYDKNFVSHDDEFGGFVARVIQHEYDHLEGVVYTDRVSPELKVLLNEELEAMSRGEFSADYKTEQTKQ